MSKDFALGDVLSITTGALVSRDHIDGVYRILNYMTNDNLFTHQLPRASRECEGPLLAQHPQLAAIVVPEFSGVTNDERKAAVYAWLDGMERAYGETLSIEPLTDDDHTYVDPLDELGLRGVVPERIIPVVLPGRSSSGE